MIISALANIKRVQEAFFKERPAQTDGSNTRASARLIWPLALTCGFLVFVTGATIYLVVSARRTEDLVKRALRIQTEISVMLGTVRGAESGQRGYLLTGNATYLDAYLEAAKAIEPAIADLRSTVIDPEQHRVLADVEPLVGRKFAELAETIRLYDDGDRAGSLALVQSGIGYDLTEKIRAAARALTENEQRILAARSSSSAKVNGWLLDVSLIGLIFVLGIAVVSIVFMRRLAEQESAYVAELERSNQELDDFAYIASHDLKEPLRGLFNHATFLIEDYSDRLDADGVRRLNRLRQLCERMERLINDLLYFSRLGRGELAMQETDPNALVAEITQMMEALLAERHARIVVPRRLPTMVCDKTRVTEVFRNLITNAVKYNDSEDRLVEIGFLEQVKTAERTEKNVFYVRDNGVGIAPEFHQVIFRIFKRLQHAPDGPNAGTGVGLTFVKKIVERHGGRIWLESEPGKGTIFYFNLSRAAQQPTSIAHERAIEPVPVHLAG
jgi:signal transduction histidine kinase